MARRRFKKRLEPQYPVITVCKPDPIDPISLKIRDLHVICEIMFDYTRNYIAAIEAGHERCDFALDMQKPITPAAKQLEDIIRIMFSAFIISFASIVDYLTKRLNSD